MRGPSVIKGLIIVATNFELTCKFNKISVQISNLTLQGSQCTGFPVLLYVKGQKKKLFDPQIILFT